MKEINLIETNGESDFCLFGGNILFLNRSGYLCKVNIDTLITETVIKKKIVLFVQVGDMIFYQTDNKRIWSFSEDGEMEVYFSGDNFDVYIHNYTSIDNYVFAHLIKAGHYLPLSTVFIDEGGSVSERSSVFTFDITNGLNSHLAWANSYIRCYDGNREERWVRKTSEFYKFSNDNNSYAPEIIADIVIGEKLLYVPLSNGNVAALTVSEGDMVWSAAPPINNHYALAGDKLYACCPVIQEINADTGELLRSVNINDIYKGSFDGGGRSWGYEDLIIIQDPRLGKLLFIATDNLTLKHAIELENNYWFINYHRSLLRVKNRIFVFDNRHNIRIYEWND